MEKKSALTVTVAAQGCSVGAAEGRPSIESGLFGSAPTMGRWLASAAASIPGRDCSFPSSSLKNQPAR